MQASHAGGRPRSPAALRRMAGMGAALAIVAGSPVRVAAAHAEPTTTGTEDRSAPTPAPSSAEERYRDPERPRWWRCHAHEETCTRPGPARLLLLSLGVLGGAAAAGLLFALGDRHSVGDPATLLVGTGALAGAGALAGMIASGLRGDGPGLPERVRPATAELAWTAARSARLGENEPHTLALRWAPTYRFGDFSRVRLVGHFGGWPGTRRQVDPRPQVASDALEGQGSAPVTFRQRRMSAGIGLDFAVGLPYPATRRSPHLGRAELRWRPTFDIRREHLRLADASERALERTMLLPLTVGARWHVSPRQRFTFYVGPRFDLVAFSDSGDGPLSRGRPFVAPLYGEAWYDLDVRLSPRRDAGEHARGVDASGMITLGYVHSRFDDLGFNFGPVIGFLGPVHVGFTARVRPRGAKLALQTGASARIGNGVAATFDLGLVAPDLGARRPR